MLPVWSLSINLYVILQSRARARISSYPQKDQQGLFVPHVYRYISETGSPLVCLVHLHTKAEEGHLSVLKYTLLLASMTKLFTTVEDVVFHEYKYSFDFVLYF